LTLNFTFFSSKPFFKLTLRFDGFFTMNPRCYGTPCTYIHTYMAWHGMAWHGMAWHGMAWHGMAWPGHGLIKR
jgi:hypothetical protein